MCGLREKSSEFNYKQSAICAMTAVTFAFLSLSGFFIMPHLKCQHKKRILCCLHAFCLTLSPIHWLIQFSKINFFRNSSSWLQFPVAWNSFLPVLSFLWCVVCLRALSDFEKLNCIFSFFSSFWLVAGFFSDHLTSPFVRWGALSWGTWSISFLVFEKNRNLTHFSRMLRMRGRARARKTWN